MTQAYPSLVLVNLPTIVLQVVVLLSSLLMNGAKVDASRMLLLLLSPVSASALSRFSSLLTMRLVTHYHLGDCFLGEMILLA
jgi:hypothetical protein